MSLAAAAVSRKDSLAGARVLVSLMAVLSTLSYFDRSIMSIAGPTIIKEFHISETAMGTVYSAFLLSYMLFMLPGGEMADRFGARRMLTFSGLGAAFFTGLTAWCGTPGWGLLLGVVPSFLVVRFAFGVCTAPLYPSCARINADRIPPTDRGWVQALVLTGAAVGSAISPVVFSRLMAVYGWRLSFCIAAGVTALLTGAWFFYSRDQPAGESARRSRTPGFRHLAALATDRNLLMVTLGYFLLNYFEYIFYYWMFYYFGEIRHLGSGQSAVATTVMFLAMAVAMPLGGRISDRLIPRYGLRFARRSVPMVGMAVSAVLLYLGARGFGDVATVALISLALGFSTCAEGPFWATAIDLSGTNAGAASGFLNAGGNLGGMLAPVVTPWIASRVGWSGGLSFASALVLLGVLTWLFVDPERKILPATA
jgi:MFS family permease